jgi:hypothetical protein
MDRSQIHLTTPSSSLGFGSFGTNEVTTIRNTTQRRMDEWFDRGQIIG